MRRRLWEVSTASTAATTSAVWEKPHARLEKGLFVDFYGPAWCLGFMAQQGHLGVKLQGI